MLYGRNAETAEIDRLLEGVWGGRSGLLVLRGEAGIGKSALLEYAAGRAGGARVLRATGVEYESGMPYAGLHMMLGRHLDGLDRLPDVQAGALRAALGMGGAGGDRFLVGLAVLTLLAELAEERPLVVLVDDAQWLDGPSAEALLSRARRLRAEPIALLLRAGGTSRRRACRSCGSAGSTRCRRRGCWTSVRRTCRSTCGATC
ncbi:hypothetical protein BJF79_24560 [Actinomadura sp. CNU-125]|uniref:ATP-binding protein n=1 Tax=Actinomadura sp. CNU-125 TaxID=1904961 RepID=UPI000963BC6A|nr:ATP-binding protein [Actinomadura sp. CNU-125]OLT11242.1 hypothetical protein BJF79_24560 [Actinomadura sp. CNU-125]